MLDSTSVWAYQHAAKQKKQRPGRSRRGSTSKPRRARAVQPVALGPNAGPTGRLHRSGRPFSWPDCRAALADKAYDTNALATQISRAGAVVVAPSEHSRRVARDLDRNLYADRNKVERFSNHLKYYRRLATCYDRTASSFLPSPNARLLLSSSSNCQHALNERTNFSRLAAIHYSKQ